MKQNFHDDKLRAEVGSSRGTLQKSFNVSETQVLG